MNLVNQSFSDEESAFPIFSVAENIVILNHSELHLLPLMQTQDDDINCNL